MQELQRVIPSIIHFDFYPATELGQTQFFLDKEISFE